MNYAKINLFDIANGKGIRVSLFVSGCQFHCPECFNESAQDYNYGKIFTDKEEKIILNRLKDDNFSGLSIIGGDPLWQNPDGLHQLQKLCAKVHALNKDVWIWSGFTWEEIFNNNELDMQNPLLMQLRRAVIVESDVFIDGRFEKDKKDLSLYWKGSSNQRVIDVKKSLKEREIILYDR